MVLQNMSVGTKGVCIAATILFFVIMNYTRPRFMHGALLKSRRTRMDNYVHTGRVVDMPCIEPHCAIECDTTYEGKEENGVLDAASLGKRERQHLLIDMGSDWIMQQLINATPSSKTCPLPASVFSNRDGDTLVTVNFYPIVFGFVEHYLPKTIPRQVLIDNQVITVNQTCLPRKWRDFSELIPGKLETYKFGFADELEYRRAYSTAYFAVTTKKGGWDCNRHYEIISSGTMPYFDSLIDAGSHTLSLLPKSLLYQAQSIPGVNRERMTIDHKLFDVDQYKLLLHRLLYYAQHRLTTVKLVQYILEVVKYSLNPSQKHSVLYIAHEQCDYMKDFLLHGFTQIFQKDLHVFQPPEYLYQYPTSKMWTAEETNDYYGQKLYGLGYGYKLSLRKYAGLYERDIKELSSQVILEQRIIAQNYSLIVFGSILRQNSLFPLTKKYYEPSRIVLIDGEDETNETRRLEFARWGTYFLREIPSKCDMFT